MEKIAMDEIISTNARKSRGNAGIRKSLFLNVLLIRISQNCGFLIVILKE
jgi:hypothetical protein